MNDMSPRRAMDEANVTQNQKSGWSLKHCPSGSTRGRSAGDSRRLTLTSVSAAINYSPAASLAALASAVMRATMRRPLRLRERDQLDGQ